MFHYGQVVTDFVTDNGVIILLIVVSLLIDWVLRKYKARVKREIYAQHEQEILASEDNRRKNAEFYLAYYKKSQVIDTIRVGAFVIAFFVLVLSKTNAAINVLTVGIGVIILIFKEVILSFAAFFLVISRYKIGDIIRFGSINGMECLGEVIYVHPLYVRLIAKDDHGYHTGRVIHIPNYKFFFEINQKLDLSSQSYRRINLDIVYHHAHFKVSFQEFMNRLERFLEDHLSERTSKLAENFKSYFGLKYKISLSYEGESIKVALSYIQPATQTTKSRKSIIYFVESMRTKYKVGEEYIHLTTQDTRSSHSSHPKEGVVPKID